MKQYRHWALYGSGLSMEADFISKILKGDPPPPFQALKNKTGALFSSFTLNQFIKEEAVHDKFMLAKDTHRSIRTFSSGEQKKALLNFLLSKNPEFLILDNVYDMLDQASQAYLLSKLEALSHKLSIIQIFRRLDDVLPFIQTVLRIQDNGTVFTGGMEAYKIAFPVPTIMPKNTRIPAALTALEPASDPLIQCKNISVAYGDQPVLNNISWEIKRGDFWQLIGPNGSGKTTLLTMITGDNPKAYGQDLWLFGKKKGSGESIWEIKKNIGYVTPAMTALFHGRYTVESMVISGLHDSIGLYKKPVYSEIKLADQWIDLIGLQNEKQVLFSKLSEEKQCMVLIARSMIKHPPLLILDEPTHGLDDYSVAVLTTLVNKIAKESQTAIIYVSHKNEKGLHPAKTLTLIPGDNGSVGSVNKPS